MHLQFPENITNYIGQKALFKCTIALRNVLHIYIAKTKATYMWERINVPKCAFAFCLFGKVPAVEWHSVQITKINWFVPLEKRLTFK